MVYVITGGPGFGKTTVLNRLEEKGFPVCSENAREVLSSQGRSEDRVGIPEVPEGFERIMALWRLNFLQSIEKGTIAFSDRGLPDQVAYSWYKNKIPSDYIEEKALAERYAQHVFVTPPWKDIYVQDEIRKENFDEACMIHSCILKSYRKYGYETIDLPLTSPEQRVRFILNFLGI